MKLRMMRSKGEEDDDVENEDVEDEEDDVVEDDDVEEDRSQDRDPHFVLACAVEMHLDISHKPFCVRIHRENTGAQDCDPHFVRACTVEMFHKSHFMR